MTRKSNYEHLLELDADSMSVALFNLCEDYCAYCPKNMTRKCNEDCRTGIRAWLLAPHIPSSDVWKRKK